MKSCVNSGNAHNCEFFVLNKTRSASPSASDRSAASSRSVSIAAASTTSAGPIIASSGSASVPAAPSMKCSGPSMCVPLCTPSSSRLTIGIRAVCDRLVTREARPGLPW
jgi:hypothetical protein